MSGFLDGIQNSIFHQDIDRDVGFFYAGVSLKRELSHIFVQYLTVTPRIL